MTSCSVCTRKEDRLRGHFENQLSRGRPEERHDRRLCVAHYEPCIQEANLEQGYEGIVDIFSLGCRSLNLAKQVQIQWLSACMWQEEFVGSHMNRFSTCKEKQFQAGYRLAA